MTHLLHLGDFHAGPGPRHAERFRVLDQVIAEGLALDRLGAWLWPGDLFHARSTIEDRNALAVRLQRMADRAPVVICYGNHDLPGDLDVFAKLKAVHPIAVIDRPQVLRMRLATDELASVFVLPYPTKAGLTALGVAPADVIDTAADALDAIFVGAAGELEAARVQGDVTLMIGHVNVGGALTSAGQPNIGREIEISARHLDRLGPIYKGLNHIHKAQTIAGACYPGSLCRLNWGEIEEKGYLVVTYGRGDEMRYGAPDADGWLYDVETHLIAVAPMCHVEGRLTRGGFQLADGSDPEIERRYHATDWTGCEVRVRYTFLQSERTVLDQAPILAAFADADRLEIEPIAVPDRQLRAPDVAAAKTLAEKFTAFCASTGAPVPASLQAKLARLEHADTLVLLSDVQTALAALEAWQKVEAAA